MKQTIFTLFSLCLAGMLAAQQTPLYILFNASCMDQLEYRYVYAGTTVVSYSVRPAANEQYILTTGSGGITSPTLPKTAVNCREYALNDQFLNEVNSLSRQVYIIHQQSKGYLMLPVISVTQVIRSGPYYLFRAPSYSFAIDTSNMVYESNIATGSSDWYIYFNGLKIRGCYYEYSFKREPTKISQERSEFDFIPGLGISTERTGKTAVEAENNQYRLVKVNGMTLEDYILYRCQGKMASTAPTTPPLSQYTPTIDYTTGVVREGDKETASQPATSPYSPSALPRLVNCPEPPGEGYHIVQPKETLNGISRAYGIPVKSLIAWNNIKDPDQIQICQKIWLRQPPPGAGSAPKGAAADSRSADLAAGPTVQRQDVYWQAKSDYASPAQPAVYATYSADKQTAPLWDPRTVTPATYSTPSVQPAYSPTGKPLVHTVQKGENLYGIGQRYGLTEAEMRRLNNYPATGSIVLQPGMQIFVADCCPDQGGTVPQGYYAPTTTYPDLGKQPATTQPYYPANQPWTQPANTTGGLYPELYSSPTSTQPVTPATYYQPTTTPLTQPVTAPSGKQASYFQEYIVREGDTITSVAVKYKVNAQELALVNNKDVNEALIAGQRLLIPRN